MVAEKKLPDFATYAEKRRASEVRLINARLDKQDYR